MLLDNVHAQQDQMSSATEMAANNKYKEVAIHFLKSARMDHANVAHNIRDQMLQELHALTQNVNKTNSQMLMVTATHVPPELWEAQMEDPASGEPDLSYNIVKKKP